MLATELFIFTLSRLVQFWNAPSVKLTGLEFRMSISFKLEGI